MLISLYLRDCMSVEGKGLAGEAYLIRVMGKGPRIGRTDGLV